MLIILFKQFDLFDPNIDIFTQKFTDTLSSIINKYVPSKLVRINPSDKPWVDVDDNASGPFDDVQVANNIHRIDEIRLNDIEAKYVLLSLDPGKATGPDVI